MGSKDREATWFRSRRSGQMKSEFNNSVLLVVSWWPFVYRLFSISLSSATCFLSSYPWTWTKGMGFREEKAPKSRRQVLLKKEEGVSQSQIIRTATGMGEGSQREEFCFNGVNKSFLCLWMTRVKTFKKQLPRKEKYGYPQERKAKMSEGIKGYRTRKEREGGRRSCYTRRQHKSARTCFTFRLSFPRPPFRPFIFIAFSALRQSWLK